MQFKQVDVSRNSRSGHLSQFCSLCLEQQSLSSKAKYLPVENTTNGDTVIISRNVVGRYYSYYEYLSVECKRK